MVTPPTTTMTDFLAIDRHGSGEATSCSKRVANRCDSASLAGPAPPAAAAAAASSSGSWPSCVVTGELLSATSGRLLAGQDLGLLGVELGLVQDALRLEVGQLAQL